MREQLTAAREMLEFKDLVNGNVIRISTGSETEIYNYIFEVETAGHQPEGLLTIIEPDGQTTGPIPMSLGGCSFNKTPEQNHLQLSGAKIAPPHQPSTIAPYQEGLIIGSYLIMAAPNSQPKDQLIFDQSGQEITFLSIY